MKLGIVLIAIVFYVNAMTEDKKREAAAYLGENVLWLIEQILIKHNIAIIEASKEAIDVAVKKEREECAKVAAWILKMPQNDVSAAIRSRG